MTFFQDLQRLFHALCEWLWEDQPTKKDDK